MHKEGIFVSNDLFMEMIRYESGCPQRIQHFTKVHAYARWIGKQEHLPPDQQHMLETAALVHDIGIKESLSRYGDASGRHQEELGPDIARAMLQKLEYAPDVIDRVCYLVGHHHTYGQVDGLDYRILVEADFLVNLFEDNSSPEAIRHAYEAVFRTTSGKALCRAMFRLDDEKESVTHV